MATSPSHPSRVRDAQHHIPHDRSTTMTDATLPLDNLEPIGLNELEAGAALLTRKDRKYLVPLAVAEQVISHDGLRVLEIDGRRSFHYESVYFDTPERVSYLAAAYRRRRRFKVRTRSYLDSGRCSLEVKTRDRRGLTEKHRLTYDITGRDRLTGEALTFINGFQTVAPVSRELQPVLTTRYSRTTLLDTASMSRITIDTDLQCVAADGSSLSLPDMAIVETKTSGRPCVIDRLLWSMHERPTKISKYCTGLAALTPGLPANKWNRVLQTHFGWTPEPARVNPRCRDPDPAGAATVSPVDRRVAHRPRSVWPRLREGGGS